MNAVRRSVMNHTPTAPISPFLFRSSNAESALQLDALFLSLALVIHSVKRSNHVSIFGFAIDIRQLIHRFRSDAVNRVFSESGMSTMKRSDFLLHLKQILGCTHKQALYMYGVARTKGLIEVDNKQVSKAP